MNLGNRGLATGRILWKNTIELIISLISSLISKWNIIQVVSVLVSRLIQGQATKIFQSFLKCREGALLSDKVQGPRSNDQTEIWDLFQAHFAYLHSRNPCRIKPSFTGVHKNYENLKNQKPFFRFYLWIQWFRCKSYTVKQSSSDLKSGCGNFGNENKDPFIYEKN